MNTDFYGESRVLLDGAVSEFLARIDIIRKYKVSRNERDPILYVTSRIKSEDSMKDKLKRKGFKVDRESALSKVYDAAGVRIICSYVDDVYEIAKYLKQYGDMEVIKEKDFIKNPKPNGYRSYHIIFKVPVNIGEQISKVYLELQIRTIAMDFWSSLEHEIKYKKNVDNTDAIVKELKRCADDIATNDLNMMAIRKMINGEK